MLEVRVLGPVTAAVGDEDVTPTRPLERALLARLALAGGHPIPDDRLAIDLWGDDDLARPGARLRVLASRLRQVLGPEGARLVRKAGGYALDVGLPADIAQVDALTAQAREATSPADHARLTRAALALWRGPTLADVRDVEYAPAAALRWDEHRIDLQVQCLDAELACGRHDSVAPELEQLVVEHPLHERLTAQLALALYRAGRLPDALARMTALRRRLVDELGVDPGPDLQAFEQALLRRDASLDLVVAAAPVVVMPLPTTTFVGRDTELAVLRERVRVPGIVTLVGPAGVGKTRLALEVASQVQRDGRRTVLLELGGITRRGDAAAALAAAVGISSDDIVCSLGAAWAREDVLLVIDNAEHLIEDVALSVRRLVAAAPGVTVLVTSLEPLRVEREEVHRVQPLPPSAATTLFRERAVIDGDDATVARIVAALDGLPLALELAAGLTRSLSLEQIAARMDERLALLAGGDRSAADRHRSLRAALAWSHDVLDYAERIAFRRLAAFAGGWSLEAAEAVISDGALPRDDVARLLTRLVDVCLVTAERCPTGPRFTFLASVHAFAAEQLHAAAEEDELYARHLDWCRAHIARHDVQGDGAGAALLAIEDDYANIALALERAPRSARAADGLRLAIAMDTFWTIRSWLRESLRLGAPLVVDPRLDVHDRAVATTNLAYAATVLAIDELADNLLAEVRTLAAEIDDVELVGRVLYHRAIAAIVRGRPDDALGSLHEARAIFTDLDRPHAASAVADAMGSAHLYRGDDAQALACYSEADVVDAGAGYQHGRARGLGNRANVLLLLGRSEEAAADADAAFALAGELDDVVGLAGVHLARARLARARGDHATAGTELQAALDEHRRAGSEADAQLARIELALTHLDRGDAAAAEELLITVLTGIAASWPLTEAAALPVAARWAAALGDGSLASALLAQADHLAAENGIGWTLLAGWRAEVRAGLDGLPDGRADGPLRALLDDRFAPAVR